MALHAFEGEYEEAVIKKWLQTFYRRFFAQQFKRSCLPDGPKVGSVTLSPRGDWRMPSDASATLWLKELKHCKKGAAIMADEVIVRMAVPGDAAALLPLYAPFVQNTAVTFEYEVPSVEEFAGRIRNVRQDLPWLVCEIDGKGRRV